MFDTTEYDDDDLLPVELLPLASPDLDRDQVTACRAAALILDAHHHVLDNFCELEWLERALRESESASSRAQEARTGIRKALIALENGLVATSNARDALVFHWT